jgi:hypothetical protein
LDFYLSRTINYWFLVLKKFKQALKKEGGTKSLFGFFSSSKPIFYEPGGIKIKLFISINALIFIYPEP